MEEVRRHVCYDCICLRPSVQSVNFIFVCQQWKRINEMGVYITIYVQYTVGTRVSGSAILIMFRICSVPQGIVA